jgi:hypothetical protein
MRSWHALHIAYHDADKDGLLLDGIRPALARLGADGTDAFLLRHWWRGPHLRLNVRTDERCLARTRAPCGGAASRAGVTTRHCWREPACGHCDGDGCARTAPASPARRGASPTRAVQTASCGPGQVHRLARRGGGGSSGLDRQRLPPADGGGVRPGRSGHQNRQERSRSALPRPHRIVRPSCPVRPVVSGRSGPCRARMERDDRARGCCASTRSPGRCSKVLEHAPVRALVARNS